MPLELVQQASQALIQHNKSDQKVHRLLENLQELHKYEQRQLDRRAQLDGLRSGAH